VGHRAHDRIENGMAQKRAGNFGGDGEGSSLADLIRVVKKVIPARRGRGNGFTLLVQTTEFPLVNRLRPLCPVNRIGCPAEWGSGYSSGRKEWLPRTGVPDGEIDRIGHSEQPGLDEERQE
jgi:hypothetical protein